MYFEERPLWNPNEPNHTKTQQTFWRSLSSPKTNNGIFVLSLTLSFSIQIDCQKWIRCNSYLSLTYFWCQNYPKSTLCSLHLARKLSKLGTLLVKIHSIRIWILTIISDYVILVNGIDEKLRIYLAHFAFCKFVLRFWKSFICDQHS